MCQVTDNWLRVAQDGLQQPAFGLMNGRNVVNGWVTNLLP